LPPFFHSDCKTFRLPRQKIDGFFVSNIFLRTADKFNLNGQERRGDLAQVRFSHLFV